MAVSQVQANNVVVKWRKRIYREWRRGNYFSAYMGESPSNIIQVYRDLADGGDILNVPLVGALRGPGVSTGPLTGNEEPLDEYGMRIWVDWIRNGVLLTRAQMRKSAYEQLDEVRPLLSEWMQGLTRDEIILALGAIPSESPPANWGNEATAGQRVNGIIYDLATATQKDAWHTANADRLLYGSAISNYVSTHAASLANIDATADRASANLLMLLKRRVRRTSPGITPYKDNEEAGREWYVVFCGSNAFRDLAVDPLIKEANLYARPRENGGVEKNPAIPGWRPSLSRHHHPRDPRDGRHAHHPRCWRRGGGGRRAHLYVRAQRDRAGLGTDAAPDRAQRGRLLVPHRPGHRGRVWRRQGLQAPPWLLLHHARISWRPQAMGCRPGVRRVRQRYVRRARWEHQPEPSPLLRTKPWRGYPSVNAVHAIRAHIQQDPTKYVSAGLTGSPPAIAGHFALTPGGSAVHIGTIPGGAIILPIAHHLLVAFAPAGTRSTSASWERWAAFSARSL